MTKKSKGGKMNRSSYFRWLIIAWVLTAFGILLFGLLENYSPQQLAINAMLVPIAGALWIAYVLLLDRKKALFVQKVAFMIMFSCFFTIGVFVIVRPGMFPQYEWTLLLLSVSGGFIGGFLISRLLWNWKVGEFYASRMGVIPFSDSDQDSESEDSSPTTE